MTLCESLKGMTTSNYQVNYKEKRKYYRNVLEEKCIILSKNVYNVRKVDRSWLHQPFLSLNL